MTDLEIAYYAAIIGVPAWIWTLVAARAILRRVWRDRV